MATIPLMKFSCNGGIRSPKRAYTTDATAHRQAASKAAISPLKSVMENLKKLLKIVFNTFLSSEII